MNVDFFQWLRRRYTQITTSIAFLPALIALGFLLLCVGTLALDFSVYGKQVKAVLPWVSLKDATTARTIIATIVSGIISLTVFSFSLVMLILNQAASQMSNRVLDKLIGNRFQQAVLGSYIGTIVYALFLLSTVRNADSGIHVPALSTYLLIAITIADIFLFIYFLHYITQSIKYETIIHRIFQQTMVALAAECKNADTTPASELLPTGTPLYAANAGIFQQVHTTKLVTLADEQDCVISFLHTPGTFVLSTTPLAMVSGDSLFSKAHTEQFQQAVTVARGEDIGGTAFYGFRQLMEVAVKALSPGINDPGTAVLCVQALTQLLAYRMQHAPSQFVFNSTGQVRLVLRKHTVAELIATSLWPIWDYGSDDRMVQQAFLQTVAQLQAHDRDPQLELLLQRATKAANEKAGVAVPL